MSKYNHTQIAKELQDTAMGVSYHGNALRVSLDIVKTDEDKAILARWLRGAETEGDFWGLQDIANMIFNTPEKRHGNEPNNRV